MIVKMKKIFVVVEDKEIHPALDALADVGVLHLEHQVAPKGEDLDLLLEEESQMAEVVTALSQVKPCPSQKECAHAKQMFINVFTAMKEILDLGEQIHDYQVLIMQWEPWGAFDSHEIKALVKKGIHMKLYAIPQEKIDTLSPQVIVEKVFVRDGLVYVVVFSTDLIALEFEEIPLPEFGLAQLKSLNDKALEKKNELERFVYDAAQYCSVLEKRLKRIQDRVVYQKALSGRVVSDGFSVIKGFCPINQVAAFEQKAKIEQWAFLIEDPSDDDRPPTLLSQPAWVRLVNPIFDFMNIIPGYREADVSVCFLLFFSVFFGILIGDAGYGLIFLGASYWAKRKAGRNVDPALFQLLMILSCCAIVWGMLTGTFFGQAIFGKIVRPLLPWLTSDVNMQRLCFMIGVAQLTIAHVWKGIRKWPSLGALAELGWLSLIWVSYFLAGNMLFNKPLPNFVPYLLYVGLALIVLFNQPQRNFFKRVGLGLGDLFLSAMSMFVDLLSYIRLFAVGMAGLLLADSFNQMLSPVGAPNFIVGFFMALILVLMHTLNMALSLISVLVHGVRLNIFEFSTHLGLEWSGSKYSPFVKTQD